MERTPDDQAADERVATPDDLEHEGAGEEIVEDGDREVEVDEPDIHRDEPDELADPNP